MKNQKLRELRSIASAFGSPLRSDLPVPSSLNENDESGAAIKDGSEVAWALRAVLSLSVVPTTSPSPSSLLRINHKCNLPSSYSPSSSIFFQEWFVSCLS